jgi:response regulator RpfG family c-di-GMP phosphodiesterase
MKESQGTLFDPKLVTLFLQNIDSFFHILELYRNEAEAVFTFHDM